MNEEQKTAKLSEVEDIKSASRLLRGTLVESLANRVTGALYDSDTQLSKFHGLYQQDDRDLRVERLKQKLEPAYSFMLRVRVPAGVCTPKQWLALTDICHEHANGTLRLTTRQAFQFHGIVKDRLKPVMRAIHEVEMDSIAACGDVNRNVNCTVRSELSSVYQRTLQLAREVSNHLTPRTRAYHEIWLDAERVSDEPEEEPIYGATYLPRKFKLSFAIPPINDVDVYAQDLGFTAVVENGDLVGYNVSVGGGMGTTHGDPQTYPRLADVIGLCTPEQVLAVSEQVVCVQRDYGDRTNRKHARLKYTIADRGADWFRREVETRLGFALQPAREIRFDTNGDGFGWAPADDGSWSLGLFIPQGRLADTEQHRSLSALATIAREYAGSFRLTANQNVVVAGIAAEDRGAVDAVLEESGLARWQQLKPVALDANACVALPTCALAMAEAERYLPAFSDRIVALLSRHGLQDERLSVRISGCPNGCSRPFMAEIALVGKAPGRYNLHLGGDTLGQRLNTLYRENLSEDEIFDTLDRLFGEFAAQRRPAEFFGDFLHRNGLLEQAPEAANG